MHSDQNPKNWPKSATAASMAHLPPLNPLQLAWAAGFIDGEGCVHITRQRHAGRARCSYRLGVFITQNDKSVLEHLRQVLGIDAPIFALKRASNHKRQCYTLNYTGKRALRLLAVLRDFLHRKRAEAQAALDFWVQGGMDQHFGAKGTPNFARSADWRLEADRILNKARP